MAMAAFTVFQVLSVTYSCQVKGIVLARKMHSTTKFAMTVLSKCVCVCMYMCRYTCMCICVCVYVCVCADVYVYVCVM